MAESAGHVDAPRAVVDRAGWSAHRRAHHRDCRAKTAPTGSTASTISLGPRGNDTFDHAKSGDCLNWPDRTPDAAEIVDCKDEHRFEVAESVDMRTFPGSEYGPDAAPPSAARIQQISQEQCSAAVKRYLGARFDPNSRFTVSMLWSGDKAWRQSGERRMLCGLQLPGAEQPAAGVQGQGRRRRPVEGVARGHLPWHRPVHQPADRHPGRLRGPARDGGHRRGQPGREVPGRRCRRNPSRTASSRTPAPG